MNTRALPWLAAAAALVLAGQAAADLIDIPTADVLPAHSLTVSPSVTGPLMKSAPNSPGYPNYPHWEGDLYLRYSPVRYLDVALTAYTPQDYVAGIEYQLISPMGQQASALEMTWAGTQPGYRQLNAQARRVGLAVGVYDIGYHSYVSPIGHDSAGAWPDWWYKGRPMENFSAFLVASIPLTGLARLHLGLGRGRFVGYDGPNGYLNTDIFFHERHQYAVGLFGGLEIYLAPQVALCAEATARDANVGVKAAFGPVTAQLSLKKLEGLVLVPSRNDKYARVGLEATYEFDNLFRPGATGARPPAADRYATVRGKVLDDVTGMPLAAHVALGQRTTVTAPDDGSFEFDSVLPPGPYNVVAVAKGHGGASTKVYVNAGTISVLYLNLSPEAARPPLPPAPTPAAPAPAPQGLKFSPIYFDEGSADISAAAAATLREHADSLKQHPDVRVVITGRASTTGAVDYNLRLAERRAEAAFEFLNSLGVPAAQMSYRTLGQEPGTPAALARRCDFEIQAER